MINVWNSMRSKAILWVLPAVVVLSLVVAIMNWILTDHTRYVTGTVETTHIDVAAKIPARVKNFMVDEGVRVLAGDVLLTFENREIGAKVEQARAAMAGAEAKYKMALHGARKEEIAMAEKALNQATWNLDVLKKTYDRMKSLHEEGVISAQQWDEMDYRYRAAQEMRDAAYEKFVLTRTGARPEEKDAAKSLFVQAKNAVAEAESYYDETTLHAPISGIVERKIVDAGELVAAGYPLLSIVDPSCWWVLVNVDERSIGYLGIGQTVKCIMPSKNNAVVAMRVSHVSVLSDFATKKATNELNSFDLRCFEVKLVPVDTSVHVVEGLTVLVPVPQQ